MLESFLTLPLVTPILTHLLIHHGTQRMLLGFLTEALRNSSCTDKRVHGYIRKSPSFTRCWEKSGKSAWRLELLPIASDMRLYSCTEDSPVLHLLEQRMNVFALFLVANLDLVSDLHCYFFSSNQNTFLFTDSKRQTK